MSQDTNNQRIAKNTLFLYLRMLIIMGVSLYTSRVILNALGIEDYGIYGIVGSVVTLFAFLQNAMTGASQRFFSYEIGKKANGNLKKVYATIFTTYLLIAISALILGETLGFWLLTMKLEIPDGRLFAAHMVYQLSLISMFINIMQIPLNALIISHERMQVYAYTSILDVFLKLIIAIIVYRAHSDRLIVYGVLMLAVNLISFFVYFLYCRLNFNECKIVFEKNLREASSILSFTGWSLLGNLSNVIAQQGGNILLNIFYGVALNTAYGIANQVTGAVYSFVSNFQMAFRPQIVKLYAANENENMYNLMYMASRFSFYLLLVIAVPFIINAEFIFEIWLKTIPDYSVLFCQLMMFYFLIDSIQAPLWMMIDASGRIKEYSIWLSIIIFLNLPLSYYFISDGASPKILILIRVILNFLTAVIRIIFVHYKFKFPSLEYIKQTSRCILIGICSIIIVYLLKKYISYYNMDRYISLIASVCIVSFIVISFGINKNERSFLLKLLLRK